MVIKNGSVYGCGWNTYGGLGIGVTGHKSTLTACIGDGSSGVSDVFVGEGSTSILKSGAGYVCGNLSYTWGGWTGSSHGLHYSSSTWIPWVGAGSSGVSDVCQGQSTIILKSGVLYATGRNQFGQLGIGVTGDHYANWAPCIGAGSSGVSSLGHFINNENFMISNVYGFMIKNKTLYGVGELSNMFGIPNSNQFVSMAGLATTLVDVVERGKDSSYIIRQGKVYAAGKNQQGQQLNGLLNTIKYTSYHSTIPL